jgi:type II secretory pathway predicted ATPase ExeA
MSYEEFFHLKEQPFSNTPDNRFYFDSQQHQEAMLRLMYAASTMKGLAILEGDIGTGKTTLARKLLDNLSEQEYESVLLVIVHSAITAEWLLRKIAVQLGVKEMPEGKVELLSALCRRLAEIHDSGRKAVVLVDEAQMLQTRELMEEFRGLLNLEEPGAKLITFIFFALPTINQFLSLDEPLKQRVAFRYRLDSMKPAATAAYVNHRLRVAGCTQELFTPEALNAIHDFSRGIPRLINILCDNALFEAFLLKEKKIGPNLVHEVADDLGLKRLAAGSQGASEPVPAPPPPAQPGKTSQLDAEEIQALDFLQEMDG